MTSYEYLIQDMLLAWVAIFAFALLIAAGFALFFVKGVLMSAALYTGHMDVSSSFVIFLDILIVIDLLILVLLYFAMFKK